MSRKSAREVTFHLIFEMGFKEFEAESILMDRLDADIMASISGEISLYAGPISDKDRDYITTVAKSTAEHLAEIDDLISKYSKNWDVKRLSRVSMAVMRLSLAESRYYDVPVATSINEAVELAKKYESQQASAFVNGILGAIAKEETA